MPLCHHSLHAALSRKTQRNVTKNQCKYCSWALARQLPVYHEHVCRSAAGVEFQELQISNFTSGDCIFSTHRWTPQTVVNNT